MLKRGGYLDFEISLFVVIICLGAYEGGAYVLRLLMSVRRAFRHPCRVSRARMLPVSLPSVEVSLGAAVEVSVPVPFPSVIVLAVQDASIPLVPSASTKASVITAFFIICSNAAFAAFFVFADEKMRSARLFSPGESVFSRCFCWFLLEIRGNFRNYEIKL